MLGIAALLMAFSLQIDAAIWKQPLNCPPLNPSNVRVPRIVHVVVVPENKTVRFDDAQPLELEGDVDEVRE